LEPTLGAYAELVAEARDRIKQLLSDRDYEDRRLANEAVLASDARRLLAAGDEEGARRVVRELLETMQGRKAEG
jgi:predicted dinucleotide-binding enzyme